jgi:hypothetical protein
MVQFESREQFLAAVMQLLAERPESRVMVLVDSDVGVERLQTEPSYIWSFGVLTTAVRSLDMEYQTLRDAAAQGFQIRARAAQSSTSMHEPRDNNSAGLKTHISGARNVE